MESAQAFVGFFSDWFLFVFFFVSGFNSTVRLVHPTPFSKVE